MRQRLAPLSRDVTAHVAGVVAYRQDVELVGVAEIRAMLGGISRQRVNVITTSKGFPDPIATLAMGKIWRKRDVERWIREHRPHQADQG